jgi:hypothetical protein
LTAADFDFRVGNDDAPEDWLPAPEQPGITVRNGEGVGGSHRIVLIWPDGAIQKQWLRVEVKATAGTHLPQADVFYFGNAIGESGNTTRDANVNATDESGARDNPHNLFANPAAIDDAYDYNRDKKVNATDQSLARDNKTFFASALQLITVPEEPTSAPLSGAVDGAEGLPGVDGSQEPASGAEAWVSVLALAEPLAAATAETSAPSAVLPATATTPTATAGSLLDGAGGGSEPLDALAAPPVGDATATSSGEALGQAALEADLLDVLSAPRLATPLG